MSSNTYVHMKFESVLSAPIHTVHSRTCRRACPCQKNLHENRASHIEVLTRSPRFLYTKWSSKMTASILLFQSNEEDLLRKWEYANLLTFPRAWLWTAPVCTFTHTYIPLLYILKGVFPLSIQVLFCLRMQKFFLDLEPGSTQNYWICAQAFACLRDLFGH